MGSRCHCWLWASLTSWSNSVACCSSNSSCRSHWLSLKGELLNTAYDASSLGFMHPLPPEIGLRFWGTCQQLYACSGGQNSVPYFRGKTQWGLSQDLKARRSHLSSWKACTTLQECDVEVGLFLDLLHLDLLAALNKLEINLMAKNNSDVE